MKIILFGSTGMLGRYVKHVLLQQSYDVYCIDRNAFDIESEQWDILSRLLDENVAPRRDILVNCAGAIPQQNCSPRKFIALNTLFPQELNHWAKKAECPFIHITTDCVFSGLQGNYDENSRHDAPDIYGITKSMGENQTMCILRTSIVGEEKQNKKSLLEWVMQHENGEIDGYENVFWNGVTCIQLAKIIEHIIRNKQLWSGVRHFFSPKTISKYDLCKTINTVYALNITIHKKSLPCKNMTLTSLYDFPKGIEIPLLQEQIQEQKEFIW